MNEPAPSDSRSARRGEEPRRDAGLTLLELAFYVGLSALIGGPLVSVVLLSARGTAENGTISQVAQRNRVAFYRVSQDLRIAMSDTITAAVDGASISFTLPDGYDGTAVVPGPSIRYDLELSATEDLNERDDNGNGLIDEGRLVRRNLTTDEDASLCENIDLNQSSFAWDGSVATVTLRNQGQLYSHNAAYDVGRTVAIFPRN
jgi:hypothetical protein